MGKEREPRPPPLRDRGQRGGSIVDLTLDGKKKTAARVETLAFRDVYSFFTPPRSMDGQLLPVARVKRTGLKEGSKRGTASNRLPFRIDRTRAERHDRNSRSAHGRRTYTERAAWSAFSRALHQCVPVM